MNDVRMMRFAGEAFLVSALFINEEREQATEFRRSRSSNLPHNADRLPHTASRDSVAARFGGGCFSSEAHVMPQFGSWSRQCVGKCKRHRNRV